MIDYFNGVTVVIPFYNTEHYIEECLASVFAQSYARNGGALSVVCVNDGSTDGSKDAVRRMFAFAGSVDCQLLNHSENRGLAAARNTGLRAATTKYLMFLDSDDLLRPDTVQELHESMEQHLGDVGLFEYDYYSPSGKKWPRNESVSLFNGSTYTINSPGTNLAVIQSLSACNKIYLTSRLTQITFNEMTSYAEDIEFWFDVLARDPKVVVINGMAKYLYRKREDTGNSSIMDAGLLRARTYFEYLTILERIEAKYRDGDRAFYDAISWFCQKSLFYYLSRISFAKSVDAEQNQYRYLAKVREFIQKVRIDGRLPVYQLVAYRLIRLGLMRSAKPLGVLHKIRNLKSGLTAKIKAIDLRFLRRIYSFSSLAILRETPALLQYAWTSKPSDNMPLIWMIGERGTGAGDNGFAIFRHLEQNPVNGIRPYYVCAGACYEKLKQTHDNILCLGSQQHREIFRSAGVLVCSHTRGNIEPYRNKYFLRLLSSNYRSKKYIFLGHGVTKDNMKEMLGHDNTTNAHFDLFWCGSKIEHRDVVTRYGYDKNRVLLAPLPRWTWPLSKDVETFLPADTKTANVMIMFTWRSVFGRSNRTAKADLERFEKAHFNFIQEVFLSRELERISKQLNVGFHFVLHPETEITLERFNLELPKANFIEVHNSHRIPHLITECDLLVTDYSSIAFDFAFYNKPTVYYQFDRDRFRKDHYQKGYFDYEIHGFGPVCVTAIDCYRLIEECLQRPPSYFPMRRQLHFQYDDDKSALDANFYNIGAEL